MYSRRRKRSIVGKARGRFGPRSPRTRKRSFCRCGVYVLPGVGLNFRGAQLLPLFIMILLRVRGGGHHHHHHHHEGAFFVRWKKFAPDNKVFSSAPFLPAFGFWRCEAAWTDYSRSHSYWKQGQSIHFLKLQDSSQHIVSVETTRCCMTMILTMVSTGTLSRAKSESRFCPLYCSSQRENTKKLYYVKKKGR